MREMPAAAERPMAMMAPARWRRPPVRRKGAGNVARHRGGKRKVVPRTLRPRGNIAHEKAIPLAIDLRGHAIGIHVINRTPCLTAPAQPYQHIQGVSVPSAASPTTRIFFESYGGEWCTWTREISRATARSRARRAARPELSHEAADLWTGPSGVVAGAMFDFRTSSPTTGPQRDHPEMGDAKRVGRLPPGAWRMGLRRQDSFMT